MMFECQPYGATTDLAMCWEFAFEQSTTRHPLGISTTKPYISSPSSGRWPHGEDAAIILDAVLTGQWDCFPAHLHGLFVLAINDVNLVTVHDRVVGCVSRGNPLSGMFLLHEMDSFAIIAKVSNLQWCCFSIREFEQLLQTLDRLIPVFNPIAFVLDKAAPA